MVDAPFVFVIFIPSINIMIVAAKRSDKNDGTNKEERERKKAETRYTKKKVEKERERGERKKTTREVNEHDKKTKRRRI